MLLTLVRGKASWYRVAISTPHLCWVYSPILSSARFDDIRCSVNTVPYAGVHVLCMNFIVEQHRVNMPRTFLHDRSGTDLVGTNIVWWQGLEIKLDEIYFWNDLSYLHFLNPSSHLNKSVMPIWKRLASKYLKCMKFCEFLVKMYKYNFMNLIKS